MALLGPAQRRFVGQLAARTGLDPRVVAAWALAEQSGSAARNYESRGYANFLNIARTDSGDAHGAHSSVWSDPVSAANATAEWLQGRGRIAKEYGRPAGGIMRILGAKGPAAQINAIATSGWASSGYNGGSTLRSLFHELGGEHIPAGGAGAAVGGGGAAVGGGGAASTGAAPAAGGEAAAPAVPSGYVQHLAQVLQAQATQPQSIGQNVKVPSFAGKTPGGGFQPQEKSLPGLQRLLERSVAPSAPESGESPQPPHEGATAPQTGANAPKGLGHFDGKPVAAWIQPILEYARSRGWKGSVTSGYRSYAEQKRIYDSGVRPAARPGTSNHEMTAFPGGAVDVAEAQRLSQILERSPYRGKLVYAGAKDPVHFSHPHGGSY